MFTKEIKDKTNLQNDLLKLVHLLQMKDKTLVDAIKPQRHVWQLSEIHWLTCPIAKSPLFKFCIYI